MIAPKTSAHRERQRRTLSPVQAKVLRFLAEHLVEKGRMPTVREINERMGWTSDNCSVSHLAALVKKGWIERELETARGIRLVGARLTLDFEDSEAGARLKAALS